MRRSACSIRDPPSLSIHAEVEINQTVLFGLRVLLGGAAVLGSFIQVWATSGYASEASAGGASSCLSSAGALTTVSASGSTGLSGSAAASFFVHSWCRNNGWIVFNNNRLRDLLLSFVDGSKGTDVINLIQHWHFLTLWRPISPFVPGGSNASGLLGSGHFPFSFVHCFCV